MKRFLKENCILNFKVFITRSIILLLNIFTQIISE
uniref:Uncharacterized protein n=1 Tax=Anguilla anguilla TaxID=7936 RepID=A0A0E9UA91_ANGAN